MNDNIVIELTDAGIRQGKNLILQDVNLRMERGHFMYLVGKTGSGKSSLLKTLYGELLLSEGEGNVAGFDLRKLKSSQVPFLRRKLGIVLRPGAGEVGGNEGEAESGGRRALEKLAA